MPLPVSVYAVIHFLNPLKTWLKNTTLIWRPLLKDLETAASR